MQQYIQSQGSVRSTFTPSGAASAALQYLPLEQSSSGGLYGLQPCATSIPIGMSTISVPGQSFIGAAHPEAVFAVSSDASAAQELELLLQEAHEAYRQGDYNRALSLCQPVSRAIRRQLCCSHAFPSVGSRMGSFQLGRS